MKRSGLPRHVIRGHDAASEAFPAYAFALCDYLLCDGTMLSTEQILEDAARDGSIDVYVANHSYFYLWPWSNLRAVLNGREFSKQYFKGCMMYGHYTCNRNYCMLSNSYLR